MLIGPVPFREALEYAQSRGLLPTNLSVREIREWESDLRRRSVFSARTTNAEYLQGIKDELEELLSGRINEATARARLQDLIESLEYHPERGFPGDKDIPPAEPGTLRDLSSDQRIKLILDTQESQVSNYGYWRQGQDDLARWAFPCWELVRVRAVKEERGDWEERWVRAGGKLSPSGRMIAAKDDPVWDALGSSALFEDGLDNPYPPFWFGSGAGVREVSREESIAEGVIEPDETPEFQDRALNDRLKVNAAQFDPEFLAALKSELDISIKNGQITLTA